MTLTENEVWTLIVAYAKDLQQVHLATYAGLKPEAERIIARLGELLKSLPDVND